MEREGGRAGRITVVLVEDQELVRDAIARLLHFEPDLSVVATAASGADGLVAVRATRPNVALLDIELPVFDGLTLAAAVRSESPDTIVAMLTTFGRPGYVQRALAAGARGFLLKERPVDRLAQDIRRLVQGQLVIDDELAVAALASGPNPLTEREREVLGCVARGDDVAAMTCALHLSSGTVRNYLSTAIQKLGASNRFDAARRAKENGWA